MNFTLFILDVFISIVFQSFHIYYIIDEHFNNNMDHLMQVIVGIGITSMLLLFAFSDAVGLLKSNSDRFLYFISCCLLKPILFPLLFSNRFRSSIAVRHLDQYTLTISNKDAKLDKVVYPTAFLLAVQETNFIYSFSMAGVVATCTFCSLVSEGNFTENANVQIDG